MNLQNKRTEEPQPSRPSKITLLLMAAIVICLGALAVFANVQRSRHEAIEVVNVRSTASPTPRER